MNRSARATRSSKATKASSRNATKKTPTRTKVLTKRKLSTRPTPITASTPSITLQSKQLAEVSVSSPLTQQFSPFSTTPPPTTTTFDGTAKPMSRSKYITWHNAPENLFWKDVNRCFAQQGFKVNADIDPTSPNFVRIKFANFEDCTAALEKFQGFTPSITTEPMVLKLGRATAFGEFTPDQVVAANLTILHGPKNLQWTVIKDAIQAYVPVLSVDQVGPSAYKLRFFNVTDYDYVVDNLASKRVNTPVGQPIVFSIRPWVAMKHAPNASPAQADLESQFRSQNPNFQTPVSRRFPEQPGGTEPAAEQKH